jgi:hypothetical protein
MAALNMEQTRKRRVKAMGVKDGIGEAYLAVFSAVSPS